MTDQTQAPVETDGTDTAAVLAALEGDKTYLADDKAPETPEPEAEPETPGDDAAAEPAETEGEKPKVKRSVQERIDEMATQKHEALREAEYWKAKALQAQPAQPAPEAQQIPQGDGRPNRADYDDDFAFIEDLTDWKAWQAANQMVQQQTQTLQIKAVVETYHTRAKTLYPEGKPAGLVAFEKVQQVPEAVNEIVGTSDIGPMIAAHLGDNPAELDRINGLSPFHQVRELTLLEARLTPATGSKVPPKTATDAPEPPPTARGSNGQFKVAGDTGDFAAFERQYRIPG
jgi:hypothetical protein